MLQVLRRERRTEPATAVQIQGLILVRVARLDVALDQLPLYEVQAANSLRVVTDDLLDDRYIASRLVAEEPPTVYDVPMRKGDFLATTVQQRYLR